MASAGFAAMSAVAWQEFTLTLTGSPVVSQTPICRIVDAATLATRCVLNKADALFGYCASQNYQRNTAKYGERRQHQAQGDGFAQ